MIRKISSLLLAMFCVIEVTTTAQAQTTQFTYQGRLTDGGNPANGTYDMQFKLFDALNGGAQQGSTLTLPVPLSAGIFTVALDFGANVFTGAQRYLEISVRQGSVPYSVLSPRQPLTSSPYAIQTLKAASADALSNACAGCVTNSQIQSLDGAKITNTIPVAGVPAGSVNYIQNTSTQQASSNFNISGNGTVGGALNANAGATVSGINGDGAVLTARRSGGDSFLLIDTVGTLKNSVLGFRKNNFTRWLMFADNSAESGNNTGSDFRLDAYNDAGNGIGTHLFVKRATGNIGIGTTSPQSLLHLRKDVASASGPTLTLMNGSSGLGASVNIDFSTFDTTGVLPTARISAIDNADFSNDLVFYSKFSGSATAPLREVLRIAGDGRVGIGTQFVSMGQEMLFVRPIGNYIAARFVGNVTVTGALTAAVKPFKIDHPLDPENKYLYHVAIESPDMKNFYDGVVTLGPNGEAEVELPSGTFLKFSTLLFEW
ncbi:MAG: hypothetical protein AB7P14_29155 [Blastocatellales bacterium]